MQWRPSHLIDRWSETLGLDYAVPLVVIGAHLFIVRIFSPGDLVSWPDLSQRLSVYSTGATIASIIGGLSAIAISLYLAAAGDRARAVRRHYQGSLRRNWRSLLVGMGIAATLCLIAQTIDRPQTPEPAWFMFEVGMGIAALRFIRLIWLFNAIMRIIDRDFTDVPSGPAPELDKSWKTKTAG